MNLCISNDDPTLATYLAAGYTVQATYDTQAECLAVCGGGSGGSGGSGAGSPEIAGLGTATTGPTPATELIYDVVVEGGLLVVNVALSIAGGSLGVTYNGTPMALAASDDGAEPFLYQYYLAVSAGSGTVTISSAGLSDIQSNALNLTGLVNNAPDQTAVATGDASAPNSGPTATTVHANEVVLGAFTMTIPGGAWAWAGTPVMISGGQDTSDTVSGTVYALTEGRYIATAVGTFDAALTGVTPGNWTGLIVTYS